MRVCNTSGWFAVSAGCPDGGWRGVVAALVRRAADCAPTSRGLVGSMGGGGGVCQPAVAWLQLVFSQC